MISATRLLVSGIFAVSLLASVSARADETDLSIIPAAAPALEAAAPSDTVLSPVAPHKRAHAAHQIPRGLATACGLCAARAKLAEGVTAAHVRRPVHHHIARQQSSPVSHGGYGVRTGDDLHEVLLRWATGAGWTVVWQSDFSYQIAGNARFSGDFLDSVGALMAGMQEARPAPAADIYKSNHVIVVKDGLSASR
jgi:hypothetical protein